MESTTTLADTTVVITPEELRRHWQGHRDLTRRVIVAFPEKEFFEYSIGGMRPFAGMIKELLGIAAPGMREIAGGTTNVLNEDFANATTKESILTLWDEATEEIDRLWAIIPQARFRDRIKAFGQYEGTVWSTLFYFIDNEIHHRGQGYVYLRSLGIEPPMFWDRK